jgi:hypothetical protein
VGGEGVVRSFSEIPEDSHWDEAKKREVLLWIATGRNARNVTQVFLFLFQITAGKERQSGIKPGYVQILIVDLISGSTMAKSVLAGRSLSPRNNKIVMLNQAQERARLSSVLGCSHET